MGGWEETTRNESDAEMTFGKFKKELGTLGITIPQNATVLDIGSGDSVFLRYLKKQKLNAFGLDANPRSEHGGLVTMARIEQMPFSDAQFDFVFSTAVFSSGFYKQKHPEMVKEIARVLKPGGIYVSRFNYDIQTHIQDDLDILVDGGYAEGCSIYRKK